MHLKRMIALLCALLLCIPAAAAAETTPFSAGEQAEMARAAIPRVVLSSHKVQVNGKAAAPQAYNIGGNNYFKLRDIAWLLSGTTAAFDVSWDQAQQAINLVSGKNYTVVGGEMSAAPAAGLRVKESTAKLLLDGKTVSIKGYNINGNNYYKIVDVAAALDFDVTFDGASQTVLIKTPAAETPVSTPFVTGVYRVQVDTTLSVRSGPGTDFAMVGRLSKDDEVIVDQLQNGWARLQTTEGASARYCSADYLVRLRDYTASEPEPVPAPDPAQPGGAFTAGVYRVKAEPWLSVRSGPGTGYSVTGRLENGSEVIVDQFENGWARLMENGASARYCSADYLVRLRDYEAPSEPDKPDEPEEPPRPPRTSHLDGEKTVIVDAGHGGKDIGSHNADLSLDEKHVNLYVAQYLQQYLEQAGVRVIMVRDTLEDRASLSLRGTVIERYADVADLFFSVHHNAATTQARGAEALAQISDRNGGPSRLLAEELLAEYSTMGIPIRSIVFREGSNGDYYYTNRVAAAAQVPALTSEFCFIDNEEDQQFIDSDEDLQAEARAQYNAIMRYFAQVDY